MKRVLLGGGVIAVLAVAVSLAQTRGPGGGGGDSGGIQVKVEAKNPWTGLKLNDNPDQFQFAVVADRTGGHRAKVFSQAVYRVNLLQPTFVMSVGDLIEGYSTKEEKLAEEWDEFDGYAKKFAMPFFYVGGNHDLSNKEEAATWEARYGRRHYHFVYKNTLFLALCSEDTKDTTVGADQQAYVKKALAENPNVRWTFAFIHKPIWAAKDLEKNGWAEVERLLAGRKYTVFCGHVHRYQKYVRNGANYYQLATTGGGSRLRGVDYGEFDHVAWVTMKADGPVIANVMLDGILPENLDVPESTEKGTVRKLLPTVPVEGTVTLDGQPAAGVTLRFQQFAKNTERWANVADGLTDAKGRYQLSTYTKFDGIPAGEYTVTVVKTPAGFNTTEGDGKNVFPAKFASPTTSALKAKVTKDGPNTLDFSLMSK